MFCDYWLHTLSIFYRVIRRLRHEFNRGTRPLPQRRSFGRPGSESHDVVAERILQWRASIYSRCLQAVPLSSSNNGPQENMSRNNVVKERILQRIEPWIRRELMAILEDSDPSVIVHVVTSTYISSLEKKINVPSGSISAEDDYVAPLRPFLHERANMFWHELRCFAESSLTLETYDRVAQYNRSEWAWKRDLHAMHLASLFVASRGAKWTKCPR